MHEDNASMNSILSGISLGKFFLYPIKPQVLTVFLYTTVCNVCSKNKGIAKIKIRGERNGKNSVVIQRNKIVPIF
jgi:hypothetical protein